MGGWFLVARPGNDRHVGAIRSLWASVRGDPVFMRRLNGWLTIFWLLMIPVSIWTHWISSVAYVAALTLWGLVSGHWSAWQAARVEVKQEAEGERRGGGAAGMGGKNAEQTRVAPTRGPPARAPPAPSPRGAEGVAAGG